MGINSDKKLVWILDDEWEDHSLTFELLEARGMEAKLTRSHQLEEDLQVYGSKADAVLAQISFPVTRDVINHLEKAKIIGVTGGGYDQVDLEAATEKGIYVTFVSGYCVEEVSDQVISFIYSYNKRLFSFRQWARSGRWDPTKMEGMQRLCNQTLGLIGIGRIGRRVAGKAKALGMTVIANDPFVSEEEKSRIGIKSATQDEIYSESDYISLHVPLNDQTRKLIDAEAFDKMKPSLFLINTCRGAVIDEEALVDALINNKIAGAGLDVLVEEPPQLDSALLNMEKVLVTPHSSYVSKQALDELKQRSVDNVLRVFNGETPVDLINEL